MNASLTAEQRAKAPHVAALFDALVAIDPQSTQTFVHSALAARELAAMGLPVSFTPAPVWVRVELAIGSTRITAIVYPSLVPELAERVAQQSDPFWSVPSPEER